MKHLTGGLADIDHAVTEVDLTTQFLHGLDKRLGTTRVVLDNQALPFETVLSRIILPRSPTRNAWPRRVPPRSP